MAFLAAPKTSFLSFYDALPWERVRVRADGSSKSMIDRRFDGPISRTMAFFDPFTTPSSGRRAGDEGLERRRVKSTEEFRVNYQFFAVAS